MCLPAAFILLISAPAPLAFAQSGETGDKELCKHNLRLIYDAIQAYRQANKELPDSLSELFPKYLADPNFLVCPTAKKRGLTSIAATGRQGFSDPRTSYFYEFNKVPVQDVPGRSNRDWKRAQMGLLGSVVPIVRCLVHDRPVNLSFGGQIYESEQLEWEYRFTNVVEYARLEPESLLAATGTLRVIQIPFRDPAATSDQIDLSQFYNASLSKVWSGSDSSHNLATLPTGLKEVQGVRFDLRGVVQLASPAFARPGESFPSHLTIPLTRYCHQLHFLLGMGLTNGTGALAGRFEIQFADSQSDRVPLRLGKELDGTWDVSASAPQTSSATLAWQAQPPLIGRLFALTWVNPRPSVEVRNLGCIVGTAELGFFLVAISATP